MQRSGDSVWARAPSPLPLGLLRRAELPSPALSQDACSRRLSCRLLSTVCAVPTELARTKFCGRRSCPVADRFRWPRL